MRAVQPMAIEAALEAERMQMQTVKEQQRVIELELQQARYEATLAERRYAACDPENRLIAAQLEKNWEGALRRVQACQSRLDAMRTGSRPCRGSRLHRTCRRSGSGVERSRCDHARTSAAGESSDRRHHRRCG